MLSLLIAVSGGCKGDSNAFEILSINAFLLPSKNSSWSPGPGVHLIQHHVLQFLIIHGAKIDVGFQGLAERKVRVLS